MVEKWVSLKMATSDIFDFSTILGETNLTHIIHHKLEHVLLSKSYHFVLEHDHFLKGDGPWVACSKWTIPKIFLGFG